MRWKNDQVRTTVLRQEKQMSRSATVMSLRTIQERDKEREGEKESIVLLAQRMLCKS